MLKTTPHLDKIKGLYNESKDYYLISEDAFNEFKPNEYSEPLDRRGDIFTPLGPVRIAVLDWDKFEEYYDSLTEDHLLNYIIYAQEITDSNTDEFDIVQLINNNLFEYLMDTFGATTERNVGALIGGISKKFKMTPIELFNYIHENQIIR